MKKKYILSLIFSMFFTFLPNIKAQEAIVSGNNVNLRSEANTSSSIVKTVNAGAMLTINDKTLIEGAGCSSKWYKAEYNSKTVYVCSKYVTFVDNTYSGINTSDYSARVNANNVTIRKSATTSSSSMGTLSLGVNVVVLSSTNAKNSGCSTNLWYKIQYDNNKTAFICSKYVTYKKDITSSDSEYANYLKSQGFTDSYIPYLTYLHKKYPNWTFKAVKPKHSFSVAVNSEQGINYMQTTNNNYRTSTTPAEGKSWFKVNKGVIAFYMDPRNWLVEERIFMFEKLDYDSSYDELYPTLIKAVFDGGKLSDDKYTTPMYVHSKNNNVSPLHVASRIRLEVGANGSDSTNGTSFTYKGQTYSGYYNFFNIGAYEKEGYSAITMGLVTAMNKGWDTIDKSIEGGVKFLANGYINAGQATLYYQKFNVSPNSKYSAFTHQYMTNIQAPATEANQTYNSYKKSNILNQGFIFEIPVYNSMPESTSLPLSGDANNYLKTLSVEGYTLSPAFDEDVLTYEVIVPMETKNVVINATTSSTKASLTGTGSIELKSNETDVTLTVTSEVNEQRKYIVTIKKQENTINQENNNDNQNNSEINEKSEENATNDDEQNTNQEEPKQDDKPKEEVKSISSIINDASIVLNSNIITNIKNNTTVKTVIDNIISKGAKSAKVLNQESKEVSSSSLIATGYSLVITTESDNITYKFSVKGDSSGDGKISVLDLLQIQKHILGDKKLTNETLLAADTSGDGKISVLDLLQVQKHILGDKKL